METFIYTYYILAHIRTHASIIPNTYTVHTTYIHIIYTIYIHMYICIYRTYIIKYTYKYMHITTNIYIHKYIDIHDTYSHVYVVKNIGVHHTPIQIDIRLQIHIYVIIINSCIQTSQI